MKSTLFQNVPALIKRAFSWCARDFDSKKPAEKGSFRTKWSDGCFVNSIEMHNSFGNRLRRTSENAKRGGATSVMARVLWVFIGDVSFFEFFPCFVGDGQRNFVYFAEPKISLVKPKRHVNRSAAYWARSFGP